MTETIFENDSEVLVIEEGESSLVIEEENVTVIVDSSEVTVLVVDEEPTILIEQAGPIGPIGPAGPAGDSFDYVQSTPAATWIIYHNLNRRVHVTIFDVFGIVIYADIEHGSTNQTTITFSAPELGSAVIS